MRHCLALLCACVVLFGKPDLANASSEECTTVVASGAASKGGAPLLWKNRDTDVASNKVVYVDEDPYDYVALVNADETSGRWVYAGLNSVGFGIMNSVATNLPIDESEVKDLEGLIMSHALRTCRTAADFEKLIRANLGRSLGSWANFGVIDADGGAYLFEVHNHGLRKYNAGKARARYLVNTNFARSGKKGQGAGNLRFDRATELFKSAPGGRISHEYVLGVVARDVGHTLVSHPTWAQVKRLSGKEHVWIHARDTINRTSTASAVVIKGRAPGSTSSLATMWVLLGEPITSIAVPVWVEAGEIPAPLHKGRMAPLCREAQRIKRLVRPYTENDKSNYLDMTRLENKEGTGLLPLLLETEREIFEETAAFLENPHTRKELAGFQARMANKALRALRNAK
jgi:hypothetical protein